MDVCKELQHRQPENLQARPSESDDAQKSAHRVPVMAPGQAWFKASETFAAQV